MQVPNSRSNTKSRNFSIGDMGASLAVALYALQAAPGAGSARLLPRTRKARAVNIPDSVP
jgi:hypothetical protein